MCIYIQICVNVCIQICVYVYIYIYMRVYIYIYICVESTPPLVTMFASSVETVCRNLLGRRM